MLRLPLKTAVASGDGVKYDYVLGGSDRMEIKGEGGGVNIRLSSRPALCRSALSIRSTARAWYERG